MTGNGVFGSSAHQEERAPLLRDPEAEDHNDLNRNPSSFSHRVNSVVQEPLTALTKVLLMLLLVLLLISSVFVGLYAGARHKLTMRPPHGGVPAETVTVTAITTVLRTDTATATSTAVATTTAISVSATTAISTVTATATTATTDLSVTTVFTTTTAVTTTTEVSTRTRVRTTTDHKPSVPAPTSPPDQKTCYSQECILLSASIVSSLDTSQDPCENFYDFATGGWLKVHPLPDDKGSFGNFDALSQENKVIIQNILESNFSIPSLRPSYDDQILAKLRGLYSSCMDQDELNWRGEQPLAKFIETVRQMYRGEIPSPTPIDREDQSGLTATVSFLHSRGIEALFGFNIEGDVGIDPNYMTLWFNQPSLGLPSKEYYNEQSIVNVYREVIEKLLLTFAEEDDDDDLVRKPEALVINNGGAKNDWPPWPWPPWDGDDDDDDDDDGGDGDDDGGDGGGDHGGGGDDDDGHKKPNKTEKARRLSKQVVQFEMRLANASLDLDELQDPIKTYNPTSIWQLTDNLPQIYFPDYFAAFNVRVFPREVIITYPPYASSLSSILSTTPSEVVEAYLVTRVALTLSPHLGLKTSAWQAVRSLEETLRGIKKGAVGERSEFCVGKVEAALGFAAGRYFVNETFGGESRQKGTKVITDIVKAFKASLKKIEWMDDKSAKAAAEKADAIRVKVGYPVSPNTESAVSIADYYSLVKIQDDKFFENMLSASTSDVYKEWQQLGRQRDLEKWEMYPSMVNAYFNPPSNEIVFPAGILQPPFFSQDWPAYLSYGSFGHVAAHELTHAFDSAGRLYNQNGKLEQWWTNATSEGFNVRQECIAKQYSSYYVKDENGEKVYVNGNLTSGENIGDTGLIQAYRAWNAQYDRSYDEGHEYLLPGLNYTREQLFFISFARAWAQNIKPQSAVQRVRTDPHSPNRFRVDGTLYNIPQFAEVFKCSSKARLNPPPEKRCILW